MDLGDMSLMGLAMLLMGLLVVIGIAAAVYIGVRAARRHEPPEAERSARALLDRRLATGEIDSEEYFERESALRNSAAGLARPGRRLRGS